MGTILAFIIQGFIGALLLGALFWVLLGVSLSLLAVLFVIISLILFTILLTITPYILFVSLLISIPCVILSVCLYCLWRHCPRYMHWISHNLLEKPRHMVEQFSLYSLRTLPRQSIQRSTYYLLLGGVVAASLVTILLIYQVLYEGSFTQWNLPIYEAMRQLRSPTLDAFSVQVSLFNSLIMTIFWGIISSYFLFKKDTWRAIHWISLGLFIGAITISLKYGTAIPRPGAIFSIRDTFPSAHVITHMTLLGSLILMLDFNKGIAFWIRWLTYVTYLIWTYLVAFSRLYLAAHWFTDIISGIFISLISLGLFSLSYYRRLPPPSLRGELALVSLGALGSLWLIRFILAYDRILNFYMASFY